MSENITWLTIKAKVGNADAQYKLGALYANGDGVELSADKAMYWFEKAADQNHVEALFDLSGLYRHLAGIHLRAAEGERCLLL